MTCAKEQQEAEVDIYLEVWGFAVSRNEGIGRKKCFRVKHKFSTYFILKKQEPRPHLGYPASCALF